MEKERGREISNLWISLCFQVFKIPIIWLSPLRIYISPLNIRIWFLFLKFFSCVDRSEKTKESERWDSYQYLQRNSSSARNAFFAGAGVTVEEVRSASAVSDPPALYPPVLTSPVSLPTRKPRLLSFLSFSDPWKFCIDRFSLQLMGRFVTKNYIWGCEFYF